MLGRDSLQSSFLLVCVSISDITLVSAASKGSDHLPLGRDYATVLRHAGAGSSAASFICFSNNKSHHFGHSLVLEVAASIGAVSIIEELGVA